MLLGTLGPSFVENLLTGEEAISTKGRRGTIRAGKETIRVRQDF